MARFMRRGTTRVWFAPTVTLLAPTAAQVNAGTELTDDLAEMAGFTFSNNPIPVPDMGSVFTKTIPGEDTSEDSTLTFYDDDTNNPLRVTLAKGTEGYIVLFPGGTAGATPAAGDNVEVWPVITTTAAREWSVGNDPARWMVGFTIPGTPTLDVDLV